MKKGRTSFKYSFQMKWKVLKKIFRSNTFVFLDFQRLDRINGAVDLYCTPGFTHLQQECLLDVSQRILCANMQLENDQDKVLDEVKHILNS